jgi:hypothetical protein
MKTVISFNDGDAKHRLVIDSSSPTPFVNETLGTDALGVSAWYARDQVLTPATTARLFELLLLPGTYVIERGDADVRYIRLDQLT